MLESDELLPPSSFRRFHQLDQGYDPHTTDNAGPTLLKLNPRCPLREVLPELPSQQRLRIVQRYPKRLIV